MDSSSFTISKYKHIMSKKLTYDEMVVELQTILTELESADTEINMDEITCKIKRASELMSFCKKQLHEIDKDLEKIMEEFE